jgi:hypothetical protein
MKFHIKSLDAAISQDSTLVTTSLNATYQSMSSGTGVFNISYNTPYSNNIAAANKAGFPQSLLVWSASNISQVYSGAATVVWDSKALTVDGNTGSKTTTTLARAPGVYYVVGYVYGEYSPKSNQYPFGALSIFNPGDTVGTPFTPSLLTPTIIGSSSIYVGFATPNGNNPYQNKNWVGIVTGSNVVNDGSQKYIAHQTSDSSMQSPAGTAFLDNVQFQVGATYSLAWGWGSPDKSPTVGMFTTFQVSQSEV